jgi:hypothetical protein
MVEVDIALGDEAPDNFGQTQPHGDRLTRAAIGRPQPPTSSADRALDAEKRG